VFAPTPPNRAAAYRSLVDGYGCGRVADALLAKWLADDDAEEKWERLAAVAFEAASQPLDDLTVHAPAVLRSRRT
jgi:hypothetical protein